MDFRHPREVLGIDPREVSQSGIENKKDDDDDDDDEGSLEFSMTASSPSWSSSL